MESYFVQPLDDGGSENTYWNSLCMVVYKHYKNFLKGCEYFEIYYKALLVIIDKSKYERDQREKCLSQYDL